MLDLLFYDPWEFFQTLAAFLPAIIVAFTLHEFAHAAAATALGDSTPRDQGRLTLNPLPHIDPLGMIFMIVVGFGWAKPVQVRPSNFAKPLRDDILVSLAGVTVNFLTAFALYGVLISLDGSLMGMSAGDFSGRLADWAMRFLSRLYSLSLLLCVFNLLPCPPLDGWHVAKALAGPSALRTMYGFERYGFLLIIALSYLGVLSIVIGYGTGVLVTFIHWVYALMGVV